MKQLTEREKDFLRERAEEVFKAQSLFNNKKAAGMLDFDFVSACQEYDKSLARLDCFCEYLGCKWHYVDLRIVFFTEDYEEIFSYEGRENK